jgi:hypothetical protein
MSIKLHTFEAVTFAFLPNRFRTIASLEQLKAYLLNEWPADGARFI